MKTGGEHCEKWRMWNTRRRRLDGLIGIKEGWREQGNGCRRGGQRRNEDRMLKCLIECLIDVKRCRASLLGGNQIGKTPKGPSSSLEKMATRGSLSRLLMVLFVVKSGRRRIGPQKIVQRPSVYNLSGRSATS